MQDPRTGQTRTEGSTLSLSNLLASTNVDVQCAMHNSGNDAFMCLFALQKLLDPEGTAVPEMKGKGSGSKRGGAVGRGRGSSAGAASPAVLMYTSPNMSLMPGQTFPGYAMAPSRPPTNRSYSGGSVGKTQTQGQANGNHLDEFGQQARRPKSSYRMSTVDRKSSAPALGGERNRLSSVGRVTSSMQSMALR
jgi:hypothetical protein